MGRRLLLLMIVMLTAGTIMAQKGGIVRGNVKDSETGQFLQFLGVTVEDSVSGFKRGKVTDQNGFYQIPDIPPGTYQLNVQAQGYVKFSKTITVAGGDLQNIQVELLPDLLDVLNVYGNDGSKEEVRPSVITATPRDIKAVPMIGGTKDLLGYIQAAVPGAITTGDQGGQVYIRGGSPIQNKVLLDGMIVYNPFHSIGFFSVFDTDIIQTADIYTGGYSAEYGGRISSIMDIKTRNGNKNLGGKIDVSPFGSKLLLEGPVWDNTATGGSSASFIFSGKASYLEHTSKVLYPYVNPQTDSVGNRVRDTIGLPFNFLDLYGKFSINGANGSKVNLFGFNFRDQVQYQAVSDLNWNSWGVGSNFVLIPESSPVLIEGDFSISNYRIELVEENLADRYSDITGFNLGFDFTYFVGKSDIQYGLEVQGFNTDFTTFNSIGREIKQEQNTTELGAYVKTKIISKNKLWVFDPSFRAHYYASLRTFSPEPRLGIKYNVTEKFRVKGATGIYSQNLIAANSDRDVVNLFYGFLSGPDNLQSEFVQQNGETREITHKLQKANHYILGFEYDLMDRKQTKVNEKGQKYITRDKITLNVEGYIKDFTQLTNMNRNKIFEEDDFDKPDVLKKDFIVETGLARGVDFLVKYNSENLYLWFVYSLGKVDRWDGIIEYSPVFDRRHNLNLVGSLRFGKDKSWEMNHRWNFGTGLPFTQTAGFYQAVDFTDDGIATDYTVSNAQELAIQYDSLNLGRLPAYHRYDVTVSKYFKFYDIEIDEKTKAERKKLKSELQVVLGITNLYNRNNVFYVNRITSEVVRQLPIMPSLGVNYSF